jgi:endonuclease/exonuclease/phosphatase family metal-dependent hydrolase
VKPGGLSFSLHIQSGHKSGSKKEKGTVVKDQTMSSFPEQLISQNKARRKASMAMPLVSRFSFRTSVMTLNAWGSNLWPEREDAVFSLFQSSQPDIVMLQECTPEILSTISRTLPTHLYVDAFDTHAGWCKESNILYDSTLYDEVNHGLAPLNIKNYPLRGLFWVRLRCKPCPLKTVLICTCHLPWQGCDEELATGVNQRLLATIELIKQLPTIMENGEAVILGGDFNEDFHPRRLLAEEVGMIDVFESLNIPNPPTHPARPSLPKEDQKTDRTIDWIFTLLPATDRVVSAYSSRSRSGYPPVSDHLPVCSVIELNESSSYHRDDRMTARAGRKSLNMTAAMSIGGTETVPANVEEEGEGEGEAEAEHSGTQKLGGQASRSSSSQMLPMSIKERIAKVKAQKAQGSSPSSSK